jgi:D-sedoheptulose 7-phosphate isomerase
VNDALKNYISNFQTSLKSLDLNKVDEISDLLLLKRMNLNKIFIAGTGGSASSAEHMAIDLMFGTKLENPSFLTMCLSSNSSSLTASGNDVDFESIFSRQLKHFGKPKDLLIVISASGNSKNLIKAVQVAKEIGIETLGLLGFDGGKLLKLVDHHLHVKTRIGDYGIAEDIHLMINHLIVENIKEITKQ